ncbi:MAG: DNA-binding domain-containing protein [Marinobacterium sp.]|nr:DNA-binding domain-containing protein [Marinobacterium sp.]
MSYPLPAFPAMNLLTGFQQQFVTQLTEDSVEEPPLSFQHNLQQTLVRGLAEVYCGCRALLGDEFFEDLANLYLKAHPPAVQRLASFGDQLPDFVQSFVPALHLTQLPALARLEWAVFQASNVVRVEPLAKLPAALDDERLSLTLMPGLTLVEANYAVDLLWQHHQQNLGAAGLKYLDHDAVRLVVVRGGSQLKMERLNDDGWRCLQQLTQDGRVAELHKLLQGATHRHLSWALERGWLHTLGCHTRHPDRAVISAMP